MFNLVVRNHTGTVVVEVGMNGALNNIQFLVALNKAEVLARFLLSGDFNRLTCHLLKSCLAEIAAVGQTTVDEQNGIRDFVSIADFINCSAI